MSYDLIAFAPRTGESWQQAVARLTGDVDEDGVDAPLSDEARRTMESIASTITSAAPQMRRLVPDPNDLGTHDSAGRDIELNEDPEVIHGLQVTVFRDHVSITLPYWHTGAAAREAFATIAVICDALRSTFAMRIYDPQHEREISGDWSAVADAYANFTSQTGDAVPRPNKRWWQFWK